MSSETPDIGVHTVHVL